MSSCSSDAETSPAPTWEADVGPLTQANCAGCHLGGFASGGFSFDAGAQSLIAVPSRAGMVYVEPGDPDGSYLLHKVAGTQDLAGGFGARMPIGLPLEDDEIDLVQEWIAEGAH